MLTATFKDSHILVVKNNFMTKIYETNDKPHSVTVDVYRYGTCIDTMYLKKKNGLKAFTQESIETCSVKEFNEDKNKAIRKCIYGALIDSGFCSLEEIDFVIDAILKLRIF